MITREYAFLNLWPPTTSDSGKILNQTLKNQTGLFVDVLIGLELRQRIGVQDIRVHMDLRAWLHDDLAVNRERGTGS